MILRPTTAQELEADGVVAPYHPGRDMALDHDHCFLCNESLTDDNRTVEHVFPRWLQRDYDLWDQPSQPVEPNRHLLPPAHNPVLPRVQRRVAEADRGPGGQSRTVRPRRRRRARSDDAVPVDEQDWTTGCTSRSGLPSDQSRRDGDRIVEPEYLARHSEPPSHAAGRSRTDRFARPPGSLRIFKAQVPEVQRQRFDYRDLHSGPFLAMRMGPTIVLASLLDWGAMDRARYSYLEAAAELELHPLQFHELTAHGAYLALRFSDASST